MRLRGMRLRRDALWHKHDISGSREQPGNCDAPTHRPRCTEIYRHLQRDLQLRPKPLTLREWATYLRTAVADDNRR